MVGNEMVVVTGWQTSSVGAYCEYTITTNFMALT